MTTKLQGKRLLIVEDEPNLREPLVSEFQSLGCTVFQAENGTVALEIVRREVLDAVISDIRMPGGDGVELLKNIKSINHAFPVVMLITGFSDLSREQAYDMGAEAILAKPFDLDEIGAAVAHILTPREFRWQQPVPPDQIREQISIAFAGLKTAIDTGDIALGRGGIFIRTKEIKTPQGKSLAFHIRFAQGDILSIEGAGLVCWVRQDDAEKAPRGYGIEFRHLSEGARQDVLRVTELLKLRPFIPSGRRD